MNDSDFIKEKLQVLDEVEIPESISPAVMMAKLKAQKAEKKPVSKIIVLRRAVLVAAALALFVTGALSIGRNSTLSLDLPTVSSSIDNVKFFTSNDEIIDAVEPFVKNNFRLFSDDVFFWATGADTAVMEKSTMVDYNYTYDAVEESIPAPTSREDDGDYSTTNIQVSGVMEADTVITDGKYIYTYRTDTSDGKKSGRVVIVDAADPDNLKKVSEIELQSSYNSEFYIVGDKLVFNCSADQKTAVAIYDISDRANPVLFSQFSQDGYYNTSRLIDGVMYLVSNKGSYYIYRNSIGDYFASKDDIIPCIEIDGVSAQIPAENICVIGEPSGSQFTVVSAIDIASGQPVNTLSILGETHTVYCSSQNLYLTREHYNGKDLLTVTKIALNGGEFDISAQGDVTGHLLNQFSLDEYNGNLRLAVTNYIEKEEDGTWVYDTESAVYVLDENLELIGSVDSLARGERIYSARFMGEKIYMVTFKETDPLFVIDASDPTAPKVLGELKIPGFSNYLHPFGEDMLIGFGEDIEFNEEFNSTKKKGLKLSLFDVSDPTNPIEVDTITFGSAYTYSDAQYNHKAILFDTKRSLFGFPMSNAVGTDVNAFVLVEVSEDGFTPVKTVKLSNKGYNLRGVTIGDVLFTVSNFGISADEIYSDVKLGDIIF